MQELRPIIQKDPEEKPEQSEDESERESRLLAGPSGQGFLVGLVQEHLEEIGFLFAQCKTNVFDSETHWPDLEEYEKRLAAHIDAIELGGDLALKCARELLTSQDEEELQAAVYALTAVDGRASMGEVVQCMQKAEADLLPFFITPLKHTPYADTSEFIFPLFSNQRPEIRAAAVEIAAYRGDLQPAKLTPLLDEEHPLVATMLSSALASLEHPDAPAILERHLAHPDPKLQQIATLSLLKLGMQSGVQHLHALCKSKQPPHTWVLNLLALCGSSSELDLFQRFQNHQDCQINCLNAMGVLGSIQAVELLFPALDSQEDKEKIAAGEALERLTGAGLKETLEVKEQIDPDELLEGEEPSEPISEQVERVCTSREEWSAWWKKNHSRFRPEVRYRYGMPFHFGQCIDEMAAAQSTAANRQRAFFELAIRAGLRESFEPDWSVTRQQKSLKALHSWWRGSKNKFATGRWYFRL